MVVLLLAGLALGCLGLWLLVRAARLERQASLPVGRVTYVDTGAWGRCERPLFSPKHRLTGQPDYLVQTRDQRSGQQIVPVEVKSGPAPDQPYASHILQLAAYCLLAEEQEAVPVRHGILKYDDRAFEVDYTPGLRSELLRTLAAMRGDLSARDVQRSHNQPGRCRGCGFRDRCKQRLA